MTNIKYGRLTIIKCPNCYKKFDINECECDKYWAEDENGVMNHLMTYQCPHCKKWVDEEELE